MRRCAELGIAVDLSHLNEAGFWDVAGLELAPLIASHSGAHALCPASRNLTDAQLDAIGATGGLVGHRLRGRLHPRRTAPRTPTRRWRRSPRTPATSPTASASTTSRSARTSTARTIPRALGDVTGLPRLLDALRAAGFDEDELERIAWGNWRRVLEAAWGG